nr:DUF3987 domain-containing protein [Desulfolutivibrio sulfoxidireducens]
MAKTPKANPVVLVEGEKTADAMARLVPKAVATTWPGGCKATAKADFAPLSGRRVVILPDADKPGVEAALSVAASVKQAGAAEVAVVPPPDGVAEGWDIADAEAEGWNSEKVIAHIQKNKMDVDTFAALARERYGIEAEAREPEVEVVAQVIAPGKTEGASWTLARELFPRMPFPWECLPAPVAASLKQLARACTTSALPLPGQAICLLAAALGRKLDVAGKDSWREPLVFWACDIRESGAGKTAPMWELARELTKRQSAEHERFKAELDEWNRTPPQDRKGMTPPCNPRGYFTTNLTLEGIHADLDGHKTGGVAVLLSELSALISGQNQYKKGGTDREGWLCLHDGKPARVVRARGSVFIQGARIQVCGGIQPAIFRQVFGGEGGQYLDDGTVFRCLFTYEPAQFYELTAESWTEGNRAAWAGVLTAALAWADGQDEPHIITLSPDAQARFFDWRNAVAAQAPDLPPAFRGFLPKGFGYALRLAGALHAMERFSIGSGPKRILTRAEMERGILAIHFYLGQAVDALRLLVADGAAEAPSEVSDRTVLLARVLSRLFGEVDNGRLAVGHVTDAYNSACRLEEKMSPHAMGALLRSCGLTISNGLHDANGRKRVHCLVWDARTDSFAKQSLGSLGSLEMQESCEFRVTFPPPGIPAKSS